MVYHIQVIRATKLEKHREPHTGYYTASSHLTMPITDLLSPGFTLTCSVRIGTEKIKGAETIIQVEKPRSNFRLMGHACK